VLTDENSLAYLARLPRLLAAPGGQFAGSAHRIPPRRRRELERSGADAREAQADLNRPWFGRPFADALSSVREVHDRLILRGARIADLGCGAGWSSI
jgi:hypothetical protein